MSLRASAAQAAPFALLSAVLAAAQGPPHPTGGLDWTVPARWSQVSGTLLSVTMYAVPAATGQEKGECTVFTVDPEGGGGVDENVAWWGKQFEGAPTPQRSTVSVAGLRVTRAAVSGTYLGPSGPRMQKTGKKPGYRLLGAIVEAPLGNVFFRLTGPAATVAAAQDDFDALLASIRK